VHIKTEDLIGVIYTYIYTYTHTHIHVKQTAACRETQVGMMFYRIVMMDFFVEIFGSTLVPWVKSKFANCCNRKGYIAVVYDFYQCLDLCCCLNVNRFCVPQCLSHSLSFPTTCVAVSLFLSLSLCQLFLIPSLRSWCVYLSSQKHR